MGASTSTEHFLQPRTRLSLLRPHDNLCYTLTTDKTLRPMTSNHSSKVTERRQAGTGLEPR